MPYVGFRATTALDNALKKVAKKTKMSKSETIREACEKFVFDSAVNPERKEWKPVCWNFFGIDLHKINYALARAEAPEEFFSMISKWTKVEMAIQAQAEKITIIIDRGSVSFSVAEPREGPKEDIIAKLIVKMDDAFLSKTMDDFEAEEEI